MYPSWTDVLYMLVKLQEEAGEHSTMMELADFGSSDPEEALGKTL